jgi:hypothetical protein
MVYWVISIGFHACRSSFRSVFQKPVLIGDLFPIDIKVLKIGVFFICENPRHRRVPSALGLW